LEEQTTNASNDEINEMQNQEPTETRDGGEYSGFEETGVQTEEYLRKVLNQHRKLQYLVLR
jgi:preprotein translocase subunit SecD